MDTQFILRAPDDISDRIRAFINGSRKEGLSLRQLRNNVYELKIGGDVYEGVMVPLPTILETHKTLDNIRYFKSADLSRILIIKDKSKPDGGIPKLVPTVMGSQCSGSGITPPTHHIVKRRFDKTHKALYKYREWFPVAEQILSVDKGRPTVTKHVIKKEPYMASWPEKVRMTYRNGQLISVVPIETGLHRKPLASTKKKGRKKHIGIITSSTQKAKNLAAASSVAPTPLPGAGGVGPRPMSGVIPGGVSVPSASLLTTPSTGTTTAPHTHSLATPTTQTTIAPASVPRGMTPSGMTPSVTPSMATSTPVTGSMSAPAVSSTAQRMSGVVTTAAVPATAPAASLLSSTARAGPTVSPAVHPAQVPAIPSASSAPPVPSSTPSPSTHSTTPGATPTPAPPVSSASLPPPPTRAATGEKPMEVDPVRPLPGAIPPEIQKELETKRAALAKVQGDIKSKEAVRDRTKNPVLKSKITKEIDALTAQAKDAEAFISKWS